MRIKPIITLIIVSQSFSLISQVHGANVSISTTSFLPFPIEAVYLNEQSFRLDLINDAEIKSGNYKISYKHLRNQILIPTNTNLHVQNLPNSTEQNFSLVIFPDGKVINITNDSVTSKEMLPENRFEKIAKEKYQLLQNRQIIRDKIGVIFPDIAENNQNDPNETYRKYFPLDNASVDTAYCTGTFKIYENDLFPYFTTSSDIIRFNYKQLDQKYFEIFKTIKNDNTQNLSKRSIQAMTNTSRGLTFELFINNFKELNTQNISPTLTIVNYQTNLKLFMETRQKGRMLLINQRMYFQENCTRADESSLLYYKNYWTRFIEKITPDLSWK